MGKLNRGFNQTALNGSVGAVTYVTRKGTTIARQKVPQKLTYRKTLANQRPRMRWVGLVRLFQALNTVGWRPSFTNKVGLQSDFNKFIQSNGNINIYLTKKMADAGAAIVAPVQITNGVLPEVGGDFGADGNFVTTLSMGGLTIGASTTVGTFSNSLIENNEGWNNGDQVTFVELLQTTDASGMPRIKSVIFKLVLDITDQLTLLGDVMPVNAISVADGRLVLATSADGGYSVVHSSEVGGYSVSTEVLHVKGGYYSEYSGNSAFLDAVDSYGGLSSVDYLTPFRETELAN